MDGGGYRTILANWRVRQCDRDTSLQYGLRCASQRVSYEPRIDTLNQIVFVNLGTY